VVLPAALVLSFKGNSMEQISWKDFEKIELRAGTIVEVEDFPEARKPTYKLKIDFGELGVKRSSAQIKHLYSKEELLGKQIVGVVNFPPKQVATFFSEVLTTGFYLPTGEVVLLHPERRVPNGAKLG
jgi:tRNA-binding protein